MLLTESDVSLISVIIFLVRTFALLAIVIYAPAILGWFRIVYHTFTRDIG